MGSTSGQESLNDNDSSSSDSNDFDNGKNNSQYNYIANNSFETMNGLGFNSHLGLGHGRTEFARASKTSISLDSTSGQESLNENDSSSNDSIEPAPKKQKAQNPKFDYISNKAYEIMENMGFVPNRGLGKKGQGRIEPVAAAEQKGRRGFGLKQVASTEAAAEFDPSKEYVQLRESAEWLFNNHSENLDELSRDVLESWLVVNHKKMTIDDETLFCEAQILSDILKSKSIFDDMSPEEMRSARTRSNPFETIRSAIFLNRAAVKMANIDATFDFMFTNPVDEYGAPLVRSDDLLYFADVCAGPGGFSEYVLWRKGWSAKGFGFTLRDENDFKLGDFLAGNPETFDPYYGSKEDGNIFNPENIESLTKYVLTQTDLGVHFMMADGGFSVKGKENIQEILSKQLYLCQCLVALSIVREKGHFVVKLFDLFTPFSVGLVYLIYRCFEQICIAKPNTSRPANSERYLICKWKKPNTDTIQRHLFEINKAIWENTNPNTDTIQLVPYEVIAADEKFFTYICESNNTIGRNQIVGLLKIAAYSVNKDLIETRQPEIRADCLNIWKIPDAVRKKRSQKSSNDELCNDLLQSWVKQKEFLNAPAKLLTKECKLENIFPDINEWYFVALDTIENSGKNIRTFFMGKGGRNIYMYNSNGTWTDQLPICVELTPNTFIYGEIAKELIGEGKSQTIMYALHIIDGMVLGGVDIRNYPLKERLKMCQKFAKSINKPNKVIAIADGVTQSCAPVSCKTLFPLSKLGDFFERLSPYRLKDANKVRLGQPVRNIIGTPRFFVPRGLLFFKELKPNITKLFSKTHQKFYYSDNIKKCTFFVKDLDPRGSIYSSFKSTFTYRLQWNWEVEHQVQEEFNESERLGNLLYRVDIDRFIQEIVSSHST